MQSRKPGTLSNGLMSLKFMQRAAASTGEQPQEAERAKVTDDSEWYIARPVGEEIVVKQVDSNVTREASYIPFLYSSRASSSDEDNSVNASSKQSPSTFSFRGRRTFKDGEEKLVTTATTTEVPSVENEAPQFNEEVSDPGGHDPESTITSKKEKYTSPQSSNRKRREKTPASTADDQQSDYGEQKMSQSATTLPANGFARPLGVFTKERQIRKGPDDDTRSDSTPPKKKLKKSKPEASDQLPSYVSLRR
ncbi:hypothetical protein FRC17_010391 [Serendipita sp. 399]|nr:hypothetical protein FRC17_010391 [Serendipita sp. 399]